MEADDLSLTTPQAEAPLLRSLVDHLNGPASYWDRSLTCRFANRPLTDLMGLEPGQLSGARFEQVFGAEQMPALAAPARAALAGQRQEFEFAEPARAADGIAIIWRVSFIPEVQAGQVQGFFALATDVTHERAARDELHALNAQLVIARDHAEAGARAKSAFLANMSHEIRTPMNAIIGHTHLLLRDATHAPTRERLGSVSQAAQQLLQIVGNILDLAKIESGTLALSESELDLGAVIAQGCEGAADEARRKGLGFHADASPWAERVRGDASRLAQMLSILASNAVKFTDSGSVRLHCTRVDDGKGGELTRFELVDTGVGIAAERMDALFQPFEQADSSSTRRHGGMGLGLALTRRLARLMDGQVGVHSEPGVGSRFWFTARLSPVPSALSLPPVPEAIGPEDEDAEWRLCERHGGARILVAEDNPINQSLMAALLHNAGLEAEIVSDGAQAVAAAGQREYALILMDVQMPVLDGLEATRRIRALPAGDGVPIIAFTSGAFAEDRQACLAAGMNDHLAKPVDPLLLYRTLTRWLDASAPAEALPVQAVVPQPAAVPLDIAAGLRFFGGRPESYRRGLNHFIEMYACGLRATPQQPEELKRELHALAGAAAVLGARPLAQRAEALERGLSAQAAEAVELELKVLGQQLAEVMVAANAEQSPCAPAAAFHQNEHCVDLEEETR